MEGLRLSTMFFSPTRTTKKVVKAIAKGTGLKPKVYDLTQEVDRDIRKKFFDKDELLIVGVPVYAGRVPEILLEGFKKLKSDGAYFLPIVVYGNRAFEDALIELVDIFEENNFIKVGYGVFIGEHSYSKEIATKRPDKADLEIAEKFGKEIIERIEKSDKREELFTEEIPGNRPYRERIKRDEVWGPVASDKCTFCGTCIRNCPVDAIQHLNPKKTDYDKCIHCSACIKFCPENAKKNEGQFFEMIRDRLLRDHRERKEVIVR
ncbi:MAG: EFR1 family ferrodoxin [Andreesenia angusta]|nr:EFR1 family ferrodoxin [Andreesenia angusta]